MVPNNRIERFLSKSSAANSPAVYRRRPSPGSFTIGEGLGRFANSDSDSEFFVRLPYDGTQPLYNRRPSVEEIRFHAALFDRLSELRRARRSIWSRIWGFIRGD